jgi:hypothetical protein
MYSPLLLDVSWKQQDSNNIQFGDAKNTKPGNTEPMNTGSKQADSENAGYECTESLTK